jgi:hypothetical protein
MMKTRILEKIVAVLSLLFLLNGDVSAMMSIKQTSSDNRDWIMKATEKYAPVAWYLLMQYDALPDHLEAPSVGEMTVTIRKTTATFEYLEGTSKRDLLYSMEINVHEIAHGYFNLNVFTFVREHRLTLDWHMVQGFIYLSPSSSYYISCPKEILFPSALLMRVIPRELRTFRYDEYITGTTSTQAQGVVGLLDELHAYYQGSKYCFDMYEAFTEVEGSDDAGLYSWVSKTQSSMTAFWEFDYFIKEYLLYMKDRYPSDYKALLDCRSFAEAYRAVRNAYADLVEQYEALVRSEARRLNNTGRVEANVMDDNLWIAPRGSRYRQGTPVFSKARKTLRPVLGSKRYAAIESDLSL